MDTIIENRKSFKNRNIIIFQGVNIEMKDHESVPFKVNDTKTESVNGDPTMKSPTENLTR